jgi:Zn-dependent protease with chaperone function
MIDLPFFAHGATLALVWYLIVNTSACLLVAALSGRALRSGRAHPAGFWITLRLLPSIAALTFVVLLFVPSYWKYEPRTFVEGFDLTLTLAAVAATAVIMTAFARGALAWRSAGRRTRTWMRSATALSLGGPLPAFAIDAEQPMIALAGVFRPRLLVTSGLIDVLTPTELEATVAHELEHLRARDNLKRLLMRAAPDLLGAFAVAHDIERRWASAAEHRADRIGGDDPAPRCALASALVKVARLTPPMLPAAEPISALIAGGDIGSRVRTLLADKPADTDRSNAVRYTTLLASAAASVLVYAPLLRFVHEITEIVVRSVP